MAIESSPNKKRVLVVEDELSLRMMLTQLLKSCGYEVFEEPDGEAGLRRTLELRPDLIITDLNLPMLSGLDMCAKIKSDPRVKDIPVIMMTGDLKTMNDKLRGFELGADDYIVKPLDIAVLASRVAALLKGRG